MEQCSNAAGFIPCCIACCIALAALLFPLRNGYNSSNAAGFYFKGRLRNNNLLNIKKPAALLEL